MDGQDLALAAANRYGLEMYAVEGLFEHTAQGDTGGVGFFPYPNEDRLRIEHPEWVPVDRWGEAGASSESDGPVGRRRGRPGTTAAGPAES